MTQSSSNSPRLSDDAATVTATAHPNIALVKYWGKASEARNIPAVGSLSLTLDGLATTTRVAAAGEDRFELNGNADAGMGQRAFAFLDQYWPGRPALDIVSDNNFPTAAGLASSASGFAALTLAVDTLLDGGRDRESLAQCAGSGSGSAARSLFGGVVRLDPPTQADGDIRVRQLAEASDFPLELVIAVTSAVRKPIGSTEAMRATAATSPYFDAWVRDQSQDLAAAEQAVAARDFDALAAVTEKSCMKMHAVMLGNDPWLLYWNAATVACIHEVRVLRASGLGVCFTIDAGPQLKAVCLPGDADRVADTLEGVDGVTDVLRASLGRGAFLHTP
ncbi:MAG: diphosphomevalonate decarboxylase [Pseudomonadota bacterium]